MTFDLASARERQRQELHEALGDEDAAKVHARLVHGNPGDVLLQAAEGAAVLVVGSRGCGGFARAMPGSVSRRVAQHNRLPGGDRPHPEAVTGIGDNSCSCKVT
ncbi:universal stress protein [Streptomyces sp. YIM S03343]